MTAKGFRLKCARITKTKVSRLARSPRAFGRLFFVSTVGGESASSRVRRKRASSSSSRVESAATAEPASERGPEHQAAEKPRAACDEEGELVKDDAFVEPRQSFVITPSARPDRRISAAAAGTSAVGTRSTPYRTSHLLRRGSRRRIRLVVVASGTPRRPLRRRAGSIRPAGGADPPGRSTASAAARRAA